MEQFPENWRSFMSDLLAPGEPESILNQVDEMRAAGHTIFPPQEAVFTAFRLTPPEQVRVILLGQDPYHDDGQAEGLAFSVPPGVRPPPSLRNIFKEYAADLNRPLPAGGSLRPWAEGGVLLLNAMLSVQAHQAGSHRRLGWEAFTDRVIAALGRHPTPKVFLLWGNFAVAKRPFIDETLHTVITGVHPSPLSAHRGFFGSRPFSQTEARLPGWSWPILE